MTTKKSTITITNYAPDRYMRLQETLVKDGLKLIGDSGETTFRGEDVVFGYDLTTQTLTLAVLHGPHFGSEQAFVAKLEAWAETQQ